MTTQQEHQEYVVTVYLVRSMALWGIFGVAYGVRKEEECDTRGG